MIKIVFYDTNTATKLVEAKLPKVPRIEEQVLWNGKIYKIMTVAWDLLSGQVLINVR